MTNADEPNLLKVIGDRARADDHELLDDLIKLLLIMRDGTPERIERAKADLAALAAPGAPE